VKTAAQIADDLYGLSPLIAEGTIAKHEIEIRADERTRWVRMLREEADAVACTSTDWSPEEVEQVLSELADKIERGGAR
jgi:hypothetical protein